MKKQVYIAITLLLSGLMLIAATASDPGLPADYWQQPQATGGEPPHDWSALASDLRPEACAQCHREQFDAWQQSLHAQAYSPGMVGQFPDMGAAAANDCLVCHAPLQEQLYGSDADMHHSLRLKLSRPAGFDPDAAIDSEPLPLRHAGISCAVCHVRGWQRFGPPPKSSGAVGQQQGPVHGGFTATRAFEQSQFCASCHQFPASMAINGKPLENTLIEWKNSSFADQGITCQQCHMPDRRHEFRGIHDADMVRKGLDFKLSQQRGKALLTMTSRWIGHAFPTYVTPKVVVVAAAEDGAGKQLQRWQWEIVREVAYDNGWKEQRDSRLMPGESRDYKTGALPAGTVTVRYRVTVMPDYFYAGVYRSLLENELAPVPGKHISHALQRAEGNDYLLYEAQLVLQPL